MVKMQFLMKKYIIYIIKITKKVKKILKNLKKVVDSGQNV